MRVRIPVVFIFHTEVDVPDDADVSCLKIEEDSSCTIAAEPSPDFVSAITEALHQAVPNETLIQIFATCDRVRDEVDPGLEVSWSPLLGGVDLRGY